MRAKEALRRKRRKERNESVQVKLYFKKMH